MRGRVWTAEEVATVRALRKSGLDCAKIATEVSALWGTAISDSAVRSKLRYAGKEPLPTPHASQGSLPVRDSGIQNTPPAVDAPVNSAPWVRKTYDHYLIISDLQIPFHAEQALDFCRRVRREFSIPLANVLCVGDEVDQYWGSRFAKSPDATHTPNSEIDESRRELYRWYAAFPEMRLCVSNHGTRWAKKAVEAEIPSQMMRTYQEALKAPPGWRWADTWKIQTKHPFLIEHGDAGPKGLSGARQRPLYNGISTAWGHLHASPVVQPVNTRGQSVWGMCVGSLIDRDAYAFQYNHSDTFKPWLGVGVVLNEGSTPLLVPYAPP